MVCSEFLFFNQATFAILPGMASQCFYPSLSMRLKLIFLYITGEELNLFNNKSMELLMISLSIQVKLESTTRILEAKNELFDKMALRIYRP